jgi:crotonobetainyl-CoA:carnitine CoA-transferase CaiB-like acyl-CoA transferase
MYTVPDHHRERVGHAQVRVLAHARDQHQLVAAAVQVEVVAVVEVAIARRHVADRLRDLMHRIVVEGREHERTLPERMVRSPTVTPVADFASGPLAGARVLDLSRVLAGPYVGRLCADMGAEVIKLEPPGGDESRTIAPKHDRGESWLFTFSNVGKRALALDLGKPGASEVLVALARTCDAVIENFRPGVLERLGLSWQTLHAANPRAVLLSINGFGAGSSFADRRAYAPIVHAATGLLRDRGQLGEKPSQPRNAFSDAHATRRGGAARRCAWRATGGQHVEVAMSTPRSRASEAGNVLLARRQRVMNPIHDAARG